MTSDRSDCHRCGRHFGEFVGSCPGIDGTLDSTDGSHLCGTTIDDRYEIRCVLAMGGMGAVFRAWQHGMEREVAIKVLPRTRVADAYQISLFASEARILGSLNDPHIVTVHDFGQTADSMFYIVMELLRGRVLGEVASETGPMELRRALAITRQIADALGHAHQAGIVHGDVKPDNIFLVDGWQRDNVKLLDFGIAQLADQSPIVPSDLVFGTPYFMSPEQCRGEPMNTGFDLYALGSLLYFLLSGRPPIEGDPESVVTHKARGNRVPGLRERFPELDVPRAINDLVVGLLEPDRKRRLASIEQVRPILTAALRAPEAPGGTARDRNVGPKKERAVEMATSSNASPNQHVMAAAFQGHARVVAGLHGASRLCRRPLESEMFLRMALEAEAEIGTIARRLLIASSIAEVPPTSAVSACVPDRPVLSMACESSCYGDGPCPVLPPLIEVSRELRDNAATAERWSQDAPVMKMKLAQAALAVCRGESGRVAGLVAGLQRGGAVPEAPLRPSANGPVSGYTNAGPTRRDTVRTQ